MSAKAYSELLICETGMYCFAESERSGFAEIAGMHVADLLAYPRVVTSDTREAACHRLNLCNFLFYNLFEGVNFGSMIMGEQIRYALLVAISGTAPTF